MAQRYSSNQRMHRICAGLVKLGWQAVIGKHLKLISPDRRQRVVVARTPSDHRCELNFIHDIRHAGVDLALLEPRRQRS